MSVIPRGKVMPFSTIRTMRSPIPQLRVVRIGPSVVLEIDVHALSGSSVVHEVRIGAYPPIRIVHEPDIDAEKEALRTETGSMDYFPDLLTRIPSMDPISVHAIVQGPRIGAKESEIRADVRSMDDLIHSLIRPITSKPEDCINDFFFCQISLLNSKAQSGRRGLGWRNQERRLRERLAKDDAKTLLRIWLRIWSEIH